MYTLDKVARDSNNKASVKAHPSTFQVSEVAFVVAASVSKGWCGIGDVAHVTVQTKDYYVIDLKSRPEYFGTWDLYTDSILSNITYQASLLNRLLTVALTANKYLFKPY